MADPDLGEGARPPSPTEPPKHRSAPPEDKAIHGPPEDKTLSSSDLAPEPDDSPKEQATVVEPEAEQATVE